MNPTTNQPDHNPTNSAKGQHVGDAGARPVKSISGKTDYLVVGEQHLTVVGETGESHRIS